MNHQTNPTSNNNDYNFFSSTNSLKAENLEIEAKRQQTPLPTTTL
jgi:hypothetical protein